MGLLGIFGGSSYASDVKADEQTLQNTFNMFNSSPNLQSWFTSAMADPNLAASIGKQYVAAKGFAPAGPATTPSPFGPQGTTYLAPGAQSAYDTAVQKALDANWNNLTPEQQYQAFSTTTFPPNFNDTGGFAFIPDSVNAMPSGTAAEQFAWLKAHAGDEAATQATESQIIQSSDQPAGNSELGQLLVGAIGALGGAAAAFGGGGSILDSILGGGTPAGTVAPVEDLSTLASGASAGDITAGVGAGAGAGIETLPPLTVTADIAKLTALGDVSAADALAAGLGGGALAAGLGGGAVGAGFFGAGGPVVGAGTPIDTTTTGGLPTGVGNINIGGGNTVAPVEDLSTTAQTNNKSLLGQITSALGSPEVKALGTIGSLGLGVEQAINASNLQSQALALQKQELANTQGSTAAAQTALQEYAAGTISAPQQALITDWEQKATAQTKSAFAQMGLSGSSQEASAVADIGNQAVALQEQFIQQNFANAMQALGLSSTVYQGITASQLQTASGMQAALAQLGKALGTAGTTTTTTTS